MARWLLFWLAAATGCADSVVDPNDLDPNDLGASEMGALPAAESPWGEESGGWRSRLTRNNRPAVDGVPPCQLGLRYELMNVSDAVATVWRRGFFRNHRVEVLGPGGKPAKRTPLGQQKHDEFLAPGPDEKRSPVEVPPKGIDDAYDPLCLEELVELNAGGVYRVRVTYQESAEAPAVVSSELEIAAGG